MEGFYGLSFRVALGSGHHEFCYLIPALNRFVGAQMAGVDGTGGAGKTGAVPQGHPGQDAGDKSAAEIVTAASGINRLNFIRVYKKTVPAVFHKTAAGS